MLDFNKYIYNQLTGMTSLSGCSIHPIILPENTKIPAIFFNFINYETIYNYYNEIQHSITEEIILFTTDYWDGVNKMNDIKEKFVNQKINNIDNCYIINYSNEYDIESACYILNFELKFDLNN